MFTPLSLDVTLITHKTLVGFVRSIKSFPNVQARPGVNNINKEYFQFKVCLKGNKRWSGKECCRISL